MANQPTAMAQPMVPAACLQPMAPPAEEFEEDEDETLSLPDSPESSSDALHIEGLEPLAEGAEPMRRGVSKLGIGKKSWTNAEDEILGEVVEKNGAQRWSTVATYLPGRAGKQCRERCA